MEGLSLVRKFQQDTPTPFDLVLAAIPHPGTRRHYGRAILQFAEWRKAQAVAISALSVNQWRDSLIERGLAPSTINQRLAAVKLLEDVRSIVDVTIWGWQPEADRWRMLTLEEARSLWDYRGALDDAVAPAG